MLFGNASPEPRITLSALLIAGKLLRLLPVCVEVSLAGHAVIHIILISERQQKCVVHSVSHRKSRTT